MTTAVLDIYFAVQGTVIKAILHRKGTLASQWPTDNSDRFKLNVLTVTFCAHRQIRHQTNGCHLRYDEKQERRATYAHAPVSG